MVFAVMSHQQVEKSLKLKEAANEVRLVSYTRDVSLLQSWGKPPWPPRRVYYETVNSVDEVDYSTITFDSSTVIIDSMQKQ